MTRWRPSSEEHEPGEIFVLHVAVERRAPQDRLDRREAPVGGEQRAADALERVLLVVRAIDVLRDQSLGQRHVLERRPALEDEPACVAVELDDLAGLVAGRRVSHVLSGATLSASRSPLTSSHKSRD